MDNSANIRGLSALVNRLQNLQQLMTTRKREILDILAKQLQSSTNRAFRATADPRTRIPWAEWSPAYVRYLKRIKKYGRTKKLYFSHTLFRSITTKIDEDENIAYIGSNVSYAPIHQFGFRGTINIGPYTVPAHTVRAHTRNGKRIKRHNRSAYTVKAHSILRHIPARPYLGLDKQARSQAVRKIARLLTQTLQ